MVSGGDDDSGQLPDQQNTDQQEPELQDETLLEMGSQIKLKRGQVIQYSLDGADVVTAKVLGHNFHSKIQLLSVTSFLNYIIVFDVIFFVNDHTHI